MSRTSRRAQTKTKVIPGITEHKPPKYKYPRRSKHHRGLKPRLRKLRTTKEEKGK